MQPQSDRTFDEPVPESAPLAWRLAPQLCRKDPATGATCAWLHAFWQCLRLVEVAAAPDRHAAFYQEAFEAVAAGNGATRMLVSGAADYSMLAHVLAAFRSCGVEPAVTVIDVCETPLYLNRWYAQRMGTGVETTQSSIMGYSPLAPFDAVCTHSFMGQFSSAERPALIEAWSRLLRPGGRVITTHPLRPWGADEPNRFTPGQAEAFRGFLRSRADHLAGVIGTDMDSIMAHAERYLEARYGYPVRSGEELAALFEQAGFEILHLECGPVPAGAQWTIGGPGLRHKDVHYASIVARLP